MSDADRYQNQPWHVRVWRSRFYLLVPFWAFDSWMRHTPQNEKGEYDPDEDGFDDLQFFWVMAVGRACIRMNYVYDF